MVARKMSCVVLLSAGKYVILHVKVAFMKKKNQRLFLVVAVFKL